jgi:hypothetical protein
MRETIRHSHALASFFGFVILAFLAATFIAVYQPGTEPVSAIGAQSRPDPNKGPSEFNHHVAGWILVEVSLLFIVTLIFPELKGYRYIWPCLLVAAGLFLALWSDGEIWPRGNLNWMWLFHHDAEARQHKIYSILLVAIGILEYIRIRYRLPRFWRTWAFPLLAVLGAGMLLIHDHTSGSGAHSSEALAYLVNPSLDVDGTPRRGSIAKVDSQTNGNETQAADRSATGADDSAMVGSMAMDHSHMTMNPAPSNSPSHHHHMAASMVRVEREHFWFMIAGLGIALFKLVSDGEFLRNRIVPYMWPASMTVLGIMLVFYRE